MYFQDVTDQFIKNLNENRNFNHIEHFATRSKRPLQIYVLACVLIASKSVAANEQIPVKKLHKFAGYIYTNADLAKAEMKVLEAIGHTCDFERHQDSLYEKVLEYIETVSGLLGQTHGEEELVDEVRWLHNQSVDLLELVYFNYQMLVSYSVDELACGIIQASMVLLSRHSNISPITIKLCCHGTNNSKKIDLPKIMLISK